MLSKIDIEKQLGNDINLFPFYPDNIKENSINLSASKYAWTMSKGSIHIDPKTENIFSNSNRNNLMHKSFTKGKSAIVRINKKDYIVLLPFSTTLIETEEVIAVNNNIGGTFHSKVGLVSQGTGHIGTMLGPNFSGHCLVAIHNISSEPIKIKVGSTFVSVVFHYLNTPIQSANPTRSGHTDKMSMLGIMLTDEASSFLNEDWKCNFKSVRDKFRESDDFIKFKKSLYNKKFRNWKVFFSKKNIILSSLIILIFGGSYLFSVLLDKNLDTPVWVDRFFTVGCSGIFVTILSFILSKFKD